MLFSYFKSLATREVKKFGYGRHIRSGGNRDPFYSIVDPSPALMAWIKERAQVDADGYIHGDHLRVEINGFMRDIYAVYTKEQEIERYAE